jgi:hypothetical protein
VGTVGGGGDVAADFFVSRKNNVVAVNAVTPAFFIASFLVIPFSFNSTGDIFLLFISFAFTVFRFQLIRVFPCKF